MSARRRRDLKGLLFAIALMTPVLAMLAAALWVFFGSVQSEGFWDTVFLQTETARSAYLISMAIFWGGMFLYVAVLVVVGGLVQAFSKGASSEESPGEGASGGEAPRERKFESVSQGKVRRIVGFVVELLLPSVLGPIGLWIELGKPSEERVGWVLGLFILMTVGGVLGVVATLFWKDD